MYSAPMLVYSKKAYILEKLDFAKKRVRMVRCLEYELFTSTSSQKFVSILETYSGMSLVFLIDKFRSGGNV